MASVAQTDQSAQWSYSVNFYMVEGWILDLLGESTHIRTAGPAGLALGKFAKELSLHRSPHRWDCGEQLVLEEAAVKPSLVFPYTPVLSLAHPGDRNPRP